MKNVTKMSREVQKALNRPLEIGSTISLIIGSIGLFIYIVLGVIFENEPAFLNFLLYVSAFLFGFGLVFLISVRKTNKQANVDDFINTYEFEEDYFTIDSVKNGEQIATIKTYYNEVFKVKDTKQYIFIFPTQYTSYPVIKETFTQEEIDVLLGRLKQGVKERKLALKNK